MPKAKNGSRQERVPKASDNGAFGSSNRGRLITEYFGENRDGTGAPDAWAHVYRLLLWVDQTTGLAHCYESDKSQPGKPWYARSLAFHDWLASSLGAEPHALGESIDWLFQRATKELAEQVLRGQARVVAKAGEQRAPYAGRDFPVPGEDPELVAIVRETLGARLSEEPTTEEWRVLVQRIRQYVGRENKRKNLVGEGFEDVLAAVIRRAIPSDSLDVRARAVLQTVPGFENEVKGGKADKVDLALVQGGATGARTLVTVKWSIRADREKQFPAEYGGYVRASSVPRPFAYTLITNEFDPARLMRACEAFASSNYLFTDVVHISTDAVRATYGASPEPTMRKVLGYIDEGRLSSLGAWVDKLSGAAR